MPRDDSEPVLVSIEEVLHETDLAWLVLVAGDKVWLPKSQIESGEDDLMVGARGVEIEVPEWLAFQKGLK